LIVDSFKTSPCLIIIFVYGETYLEFGSGEMYSKPLLVEFCAETDILKIISEERRRTNLLLNTDFISVGCLLLSKLDNKCLNGNKKRVTTFAVTLLNTKNGVNFI
jgi:hypothetical protein